jgi:bifunctional DNase/RNase
VVLAEIGGARRLEIWVGRFEGEAIAVQLEGVAFPRPLTFTLMAGLLQAGGVRVRAVRISRLVEDVFYATVLVEPPGGAEPAEVDARPSDALALALAAGVPIQVAPAVFAAVPAGEPTDEAAQENAAAIAASVRGSSPGAGASITPPAAGPPG